MRAWSNQYQSFYGNLQINYPGGASFGGALNIAANAGIAALGEFAGNGTVLGTSSLAVGQTTAGVATILARGAQALNIGVNGGGQISISAGGALTITDTTGSVWGAATGGAQGTGTINAVGLFVNGVAVGGGATTGSFTGTFTGFTGSPTASCLYTVIGNACTLYLGPAGTLGTSNATTMTMTGLPAAIRPAKSQGNIMSVQDVGAAQAGNYIIAAAGTLITFGTQGFNSGGGFTNSGNKGLGGTTITYLLN